MTPDLLKWGQLAHGQAALVQSVEVYGFSCKLHPSFAVSFEGARAESGEHLRFDGPVEVNKPPSLGAAVPGLTPLRPPRPRTQTRFALKIHLQGSNPRLQGFALCHTVAPDTQVLGCAHPCTDGPSSIPLLPDYNPMLLPS